MNFKIKNLENLEGREKLDNIFAHLWRGLGSPVSEILKAYENIGLDSSFWEDMEKGFEEKDGVHAKEYEWTEVKGFIPIMEHGIQKIRENRAKFPEWQLKFVTGMLEAILKVARTCVKHKRSLEITI